MTTPAPADPASRPGAADGSDRAACELVELTNELVGRIWGHFQARAAELSLSIPEAKALRALEPGEPLPMRELAARIHQSPSNLTVTVDRLVGRGLVARREGDDRRVKSVLLTDAGLALREQLETRLATDHPASRGLDSAQIAALVELLRIVVRPPS